jgi:hypothetical protein
VDVTKKVPEKLGHLVCRVEPGGEILFHVVAEERVEPLEQGVVEAEVQLSGFPDCLLEFADDVTAWANLGPML